MITSLANTQAYEKHLKLFKEWFFTHFEKCEKLKLKFAIKCLHEGVGVCGQYGIQRTSILYANSCGPRISTIRPTAAWSTPTVSLNPRYLEVVESFSRCPYRLMTLVLTLERFIDETNKERNLVDVLVFIHQNEEFWILNGSEDKK